MRQQMMQQSAAVSSRRSEPAPGWGNRSRMPVMKPSTPTNCGTKQGSVGTCHPSSPCSPSPWFPQHLAVQPQHQEHDEKECGPQRGQGHQRHSFGVGDESQSGTCRRVGSEMPLKGGDTEDTVGTHCPSLTGLGHLGDVHALLRGHEAEHREDNEAGKEAGAAVDHSQDVGVPVGTASKEVLGGTGGHTMESLGHTRGTACSWHSPTCSSCCGSGCSCPVQSGRPARWHKRRRPGCQHQSRPGVRRRASGWDRGAKGGV